jgi:raffinose/stachyose/melibiose transport system permease protein
MKNLKLLGTYFTLILPYIAFNFPLGVLILRSFFEKIPIEIKEAAKIDGASDFRVFLRIILPLSRPALATLTILSFMAVWNEFLFALVFIRDNSMQTIPLILSRMGISRYGVDYGVYGAFITMTMIPMLIIFLIFQRWFIAGLSAGAVKG